jgi:hypothetical protein
MLRWLGSFTYLVRTMTVGRSSGPATVHTGFSLSASTMTARLFITSTSARLNDTTDSGSYPALRTSVLVGDRLAVMVRSATAWAGVICSPPRQQKRHCPSHGSAQHCLTADIPVWVADRQNVSGSEPGGRTGISQWSLSRRYPFPIGDRNEKTLTRGRWSLLYWRAVTTRRHTGGWRTLQ